MTVNVRNQRPSAVRALTKSMDHRSLGRVGAGSGTRARLANRFRGFVRTVEPSSVEPISPFRIHAPAFAFQQHRQPAIAEPPADGRQLAQPLAESHPAERARVLRISHRCQTEEMLKILGKSSEI